MTTYNDLAIKYAARSSIKRHKTGAVLVTRTGRVVYGWSHVSNLNLKSAEYSMHAELHCLFRSRHLDLNGSRIYVATLTKKTNNVVCGKPCVICKAALIAAGVIDCYYSVPGDTWLLSNLIAPRPFHKSNAVQHM